MRLLGSRLALFGLLALLVGCDHVTKHVAKTRLETAAPRPLVQGILDLHYRENTDVAFNLLRFVPESTRKPVLVVAGGAGVLALLVLLGRWAGRGATTVAVLLVTAGALGNYADRIARGYVVDFVHHAHWPVFNDADTYVTVGVVLLALVTLRRRAQKPASSGG